MSDVTRGWKALLGGTLLAGVLGGVAGCTWVKLSDDGAQVRQAKADEVGNCRHIGMVTTHTRDKVVLERNTAKVHEELLVLARNEAATLGGDTIVPTGPAVEGRQEFDVYGCGQDSGG